MEKDNHRYQLKDVINVTSLDTAITIFEQISDLEGTKQKGEDIFLSRLKEDGTEECRVKVNKTLKKITEGFIMGVTSELTHDGFGEQVRAVFAKHTAERSRSGEGQ